MTVLNVVKDIARRWVPKRIWGHLRVLRMEQSIRSFKPREIVHTYGSRKMTIHVSDPLARAWYDRDWPEPAEITLLRRHKLKPGATVFDLGAHQGVVALILGDAVGPTGKVVAVEANPYNADAARRNRDANGSAQIVIEAAAVSDQLGELTFNRGLNGHVDDGSGQWGTMRVPALTVDLLSERHGAPDVLFIDVEGYELHALRGGKKTLEKFPDCFIEMHVGVGLEKNGGSVRAILDTLGDRYEFFMSNESEQTPVAFDIEHPMVKERFFLTAIAKLPAN
jgi:FkbM family methyltransferase